MTFNAGWTGMLEFVAETTFGVIPENPTMEYIGVVETSTISDNPIITSKRYLVQDGYTDTAGNLKTSAYKHQKTSSEISVDLTYYPKSIWSGFLPYALGNPSLTGGAAVTGAVDNIGDSFSVGGYVLGTPKYIVYSGGYVESLSIEIPKDEMIKCDATLGFANSGSNVGSPTYANTANPLASDYVGTGSHAAEVVGDILTFDSVTASTLTPDEGSAVNDILESVTINIDNNVEWIKELGSGFSTKRSAAQILGRDITLSIELTYDDLALYDEIFNGTDFTYSMTIDGYIFEFGGFKFPEYPLNMNPEELLGESIESTQVTTLKITEPLA